MFASCKHGMKRVQINSFLQCFADRNLKTSNNQALYINVCFLISLLKISNNHYLILQH
jgi:hypothetical protein